MKYDGIVIGGGPAGIFAAITAGERGLRILLIEKNERLGKKLLITGKGRCNITNACSAAEVLQNIPRNGKFLFSAMDSFPPEKIMTFFSDHGCPIKTERGNRVFPQSDRSQSVLDCLKRKLNDLNVECTSARAEEIVVENSAVTGVRTNRGFYSSDWVILATGGISYPATGSSGDGYKMSQRLGHTVVSPVGSLVPLESNDSCCGQMQGLSLRNVGVKLVNGKGKLLYKDFGELLFTHFGVSGPTVLSASSHLQGTDFMLFIDLKPALDHDKLNDRILRDLDQYRNRTMENALTDLLPRSMIPVVLQKLGVKGDLQANSFSKEYRKKLVELLKAFPITISGRRPVEEAIITSGGIKTSEINPKTMESKLIHGLYFAGEIIDCDGYTGGFNLQIAWATAYVAGSSVKSSIDKQPGVY